MAIDLEKVRQLIDLIKETGVAEIEIREGEDTVRINRGSNHTPPTTFTPPTVTVIEQAAPLADTKPNEPAKIDGHTVNSPMVGTFYSAPAPDAKPFIEVGQAVKVGQVLCIIEAMKMMNQIEADKAGILKAKLVENGKPVEFGQALFVIE